MGLRAKRAKNFGSASEASRKFWRFYKEKNTFPFRKIGIFMFYGVISLSYCFMGGDPLYYGVFFQCVLGIGANSRWNLA